VQSEKHDREIVSMDDGRKSDWSDEHFRKALSPRTATILGDLNVKLDRFAQSAKQDSGIASTNLGMQID
jgi:hypothetical protein